MNKKLPRKVGTGDRCSAGSRPCRILDVSPLKAKRKNLARRVVFVGVGITEKGSWGIAVRKIPERA
jgi:hypothetical protein